MSNVEGSILALIKGREASWIGESSSARSRCTAVSSTYVSSLDWVSNWSQMISHLRIRPYAEFHDRLGAYVGCVRTTCTRHRLSER